MTFPKFLNINLRDLGKSFIVTVLSTAIAFIYNAAAGNLPTIEQLKTSLLVGITAGVSYIIKQLMTGIPPVVEINPETTVVVDEKSKQVLVNKKDTDVRNITDA